MRRLAVGASAVAVVALFPCVASATTFTVSGTTDPIGATCSGSTCQSLRAAVTAASQPANLGSTVQLGSGTYALGGSGMVSGALNIGADLTISGAGAGATVIRQTTADDGVVVISSPTAHVTLSGLEITGEQAIDTDAVGGILDQGALTLTNVDVDGNTAIGLPGATNSSGPGGPGGRAVGGVEVASGASLTATGGEISGNTAGGGGGGFYTGSSTGAGGAGGDAVSALAIDAGAGSVSLTDTNVSSDIAAGGMGGDDGDNHGPNGTSGTATAIDDQSTSPVSIDGATLDGDISTGGPGRNAGAEEDGAAGGNVAGGAIDDAGGAMTVSDASLVGDRALGGAGGLTITVGNPGAGGAAEGGAIAVTSNGALTLVRSTLAEDDAVGGSAGLFEAGSVATTGGDGGIGLGGGLFLLGAGRATLVNDTLAEDQASGGTHSIVEAGANTPITTGSDGPGYGGAISDQSTAGGTTLTLASDTIAASVASSPTTGTALAGNIDIGASTWSIRDTVVAGGSAAGGEGNCAIGEAPTDAGHNLEDTTPAQCGLSAAHLDLVGVAPQLGALTAAAGTTLATYAPQAASPLRGAGGACIDPSQSGDPALATDERGAPRHSSCDIGAYETEPPSGAITLGGSTAAGSVLSCPTSAIHGDAPLSFATPDWLVNGKVVATSTTFSVSPAATVTTLSCAVAATNPYGTITVASNGLAIPSASTTQTPTGSAKFKGVTLVSRTLHVVKGRIAVVVTCPASIPGGVCRVTVAIRSGKRKLGQASATVRARKRHTLLVAVARAERARVRRHPDLPVIVALTTRDNAGAKVSSSPHGRVAPPVAKNRKSA